MTDRAPTRRQSAKIRTRKKILAAARDLFLSEGYEATTVRGVAKAAGMSTGAVFNTVVDKAQLWREAMGGPPPMSAVADEIALVMAQLPDWTWSLGMPLGGGKFTAAIRTPDFNPALVGQGAAFAGEGSTPAVALAMARLDALRHARGRPGLRRVA